MGRARRVTQGPRRLWLRGPAGNSIEQAAGSQLIAELSQPFPRTAPFEMFEVFLEGDVGAKSRQAAEKEGVLPVGVEILCEAEGATSRQAPLAMIFRDGLEVLVFGEHRGGGFLTPSGDPRVAVRRVTHQPQPVGDGTWRNTELLDDRGFVINELSAAVPTHDPVPGDQLSQVFVG